MSRIQLVLISSLFIGCTSGFESTSELSEAPTNLTGKDPTQTVPGNPTCQSLGLGDSEFKLNSPPTGSSTHNLGSAGTITFQIDSSGIFLDWTATLGIDGVIVKGGTAANIYVYNPEALADSGLHSPINSSGHFAAISHISICYDVEPDLCAGVVCAPADACQQEGVCEPTTGQCAYAPKPAGTTCRASAGACDVAEVCDGSSGACPADEFLPTTTECRGSAGACDPAEYCTGDSAACPADDLTDQGTTCRASAGACDVAEVCTGDSAACPADDFADQGTTCRASAGACDVAEVCTGASAECPDDGKSTAVCRAAAGDCDVAEVCDGASNECPADGFSAGNTCRASAGICDVAEVCSGSSASCPADGFATGTICRAAAGDCDVAEQCTGASASCPTDVLVPAGTECRGAADACDPAEACTGLAAACPADVSATCQVCGDKYYDANTNSAQDAGELSIAGWKVTITDANGNETSAYTNAGGTYLFASLAAGAYTVCEEMPIGDAWFQTAPAEICYSVSLPLPSNECTYDFGNVCLGAGGGHTPGFWQNKNGKTMFMGTDNGASSLALVVSLNLRTGTGAHFDPASYQQFAQWLSATNAVNMAAQLSRHLAAMALNVKVGFVDGTDLVHAPGAQGANAMGFITIDALIAEANTELGLHGDTWIPGPARIYQEALKNALDAANNNKNFVQPEACDFTFEALVDQVAHDRMHDDGLPRDGSQPDVDQGGCSTTGTGASLTPILLALGMLLARRRRR